jgi:hypothetical protein
MYTFLAVIAVTLALQIAEVFFAAPPVVQKAFGRAERIREFGRGRAYFSLLVLYPLVLTAAFYALGTVAGVAVGFAAALADVATFFGLILVLGIMSCFFSFLRDLGSIAASKITGLERSSTPDVSLLTTIVFTSAMYGSLVAVALKAAGIIDFGN